MNGLKENEVTIKHKIMKVSKYTVTVDLAKNHIKYGNYDISVYKADVIKLCRHVEELQEKVKKLTVIQSSQQLKEKETLTFEEWLYSNCFKKQFGIYEYKDEHYELSNLKSIYRQLSKEGL